MRIGVMDSGIGGMSVLRDALATLPQADFVYLGDNTHAPYGERTREDICALTQKCAAWLIRQDIDALLVACNTATSAAITVLRQTLPIPVVGMEPALKPAWAHHKQGKIVVMATPATLALEKFHDLSSRIADPSCLIPLPSAPLVRLVETGVWDGAAMIDCLAHLLEPLSDTPIDAVVLGCTHFLFAKDAIIEYLYARHGCVPLIDGNQGTVNHLIALLPQEALCTPDGQDNHVAIYTTGDPNRYAPVIMAMKSQTHRISAVTHIAID